MIRFILAITAILVASAAQADEFFGVKLEPATAQKVEDIYNNTSHGNALLEEVSGNVKTLLDRVKPAEPAAREFVIDVPLLIAPPDVKGSVVKIRSIGDWYNPTTRKIQKNTTFGGTAVADSENTFRTVAHLTEGLRGAFRVDVEIGDKWKGCSYQSTPGVDHAVATLPGHGVTPVKTRQPQYMETVWVYGMRTQVMKKGIYTSHGVASLDKWVHRIDQGDSGGGVFSSSGELLGTLRGYQDRVENAATFTEIGEEAAKVAAVPAKPAAPPQNCPNGQCPLQQPSQSQWFFGGRRR
jgi:hypothetical protein